MRSLILLVIVCHLQVKSNQIEMPVQMPAKPELCHADPDLLYRQCCIFPPFFTRDIAKSCGAIFEVTFRDTVFNITGLRRQAITGCRHWQCMLDKYDLLNEFGYVDNDKYFAHLDLWVELNPMFADTMGAAKTTCKNDYRYFFPLKPCEFFNFHGCIRNFINVNCPIYRPTKACHELRDFYSKCKDYYIKK